MPAIAPGGVHDTGRRSQRIAAALLALVALGILVSRALQARESLWLDELHTAWTSIGGWGEVASRSVAGNQSPIFFWLEWLLVHAMGASEIVLRLPSLIAGMLLAIAIYWLIQVWIGSRWLGLLPAWLLAVDPQAAYYGTEARPYALVQLLSVLHIALFTNLVERPTRLKRAVMIAGAALLFHLHYTAALVLAAELAWYVWRRANSRQAYAVATLTFDFAATALLAAPALGVLRAIGARRANWEAFVPQQPVWTGLAMLPWAVTALVTAALVFGWRRSRGLTKSAAGATQATTAMAVCWILVPVGVAWLATATDTARLLSPRYIAGSAPAALVLLALAINAIPAARIRGTVAVVIAIVGTVASPSARLFATSSRLIDWRTDDWRAAVDYFNRDPRRGDGVVLLRSLLIESDALVTTPADSALNAYLLYPITSLYPIDARRERLVPLPRSGPSRLTTDAIERIRELGTVWLVFGGSADAEMAAEAELSRTLSAQSATPWTAVSRRAFGSVHVALLKRGSP